MPGGQPTQQPDPKSLAFRARPQEALPLAKLLRHMGQQLRPPFDQSVRAIPRPASCRTVKGLLDCHSLLCRFPC
jgi:hypothetical protein